MSTSKTAFEQELEQVIRLYEKLTGFPATRTRKMIEEHGRIEALSRLVKSADLQKGFKVLRDSGQLEHTFEALMIRFSDLFKKDAIDAADFRLKHSNDLF